MDTIFEFSMAVLITAAAIVAISVAAVIASKIPEFEKLIEDGENGYILGDEVTDDDIEKIFTEVPKPKAYSEKIDSLWEKVMEGEL